MNPEPSAVLTASDEAFLRRWIKGDSPPMIIEPDCEERLTAAGLARRISSHLQLTNAGKRYFDDERDGHTGC